MYKDIKRIITNSIDVKRQVLANEKLLAVIEKVAEVCVIALKSDKKIMFCGNGGSAADAQHLAGELSGRFYLDREPLYADALDGNAAYITAVANDYDFSEVYSRQVRGKGHHGDVLIGLSTSGNSMNVLKAFDQARNQHVLTVGMTGATGGKLAALSDFLISVPSVDTPRIQEAHMLIGHAICELVEKNIFKKSVVL